MLLRMPGGYKDLLAWQKAMELVMLIYEGTVTFPPTELYGLQSQMRRSAVSIPSNIAEGSKRGTAKDFCHFLNIAYGSGVELETQLEISKRLTLGKQELLGKSSVLLDEIMKMIFALKNSL